MDERLLSISDPWDDYSDVRDADYFLWDARDQENVSRCSILKKKTMRWIKKSDDSGNKKRKVR